MKTIYILMLSMLSVSAAGQQIVTGTTYDNETKEPLIGATIMIRSTGHGVLTNTSGKFEIPCNAEFDTLEVSFIGYDTRKIPVTTNSLSIALAPSVDMLEQIVVTANREASLRTESPIAISKLSSTTINETKPVLITELMNKIPGIVMLNYNNEQHGMAIRQPMGTSAYFLYMEDGIALRPMGIFNHNALIEMNVFSLSSIEVVKGPASSMYGPEAVGGAINFITHRPTSVQSMRVGVQADQWGYKRFQYAAGGMLGKKIGIYLSGFEAKQRDAWQAYSDYEKSSTNVRVDYTLSDKTTLTATVSRNEYYSQMPGSVDSSAFYARTYSSTTDFTYRQVHSFRARVTATHRWNEQNETSVTVAYRDNYIEQNPNYAIRWTRGSTNASGERNRNSFTSNVATFQHSLKINFLNTRLMAGGSIDHSPTDYWSYILDLSAKLSADGKSVEKYSIVGERPDEFISKYEADLKNYALYSQLESNPLERLKITLGLRYDMMAFDYTNQLDFTSGNKSYRQITPKIGATFDLLHDKGLYANYSKGFSPPGLTSIFRKKANPSMDESAFYYNLKPARFNNIEFGAWGAFVDNTIYVDVAVYQMTGRNELLNVRQPDNSTNYESAGRTLHRGIEYGVTYRPHASWSMRFGGTNAVHRFEDFKLSTRSTDALKNVNGNEMPQSPRWIANTEVTYKPEYIRGLRISFEWQRIGSWFQDQANHIRYDDRGLFGLKGISYINLRAGYEWRGIEIFTNIMNATNEMYANTATRGNALADRTTFTPSAPRTVVAGIQYTLRKEPRSKS